MPDRRPMQMRDNQSDLPELPREARGISTFKPGQYEDVVKWLKSIRKPRTEGVDFVTVPLRPTVHKLTVVQRKNRREINAIRAKRRKKRGKHAHGSPPRHKD